MSGFLATQSAASQTEAIYVAYFGRAADGPGYLYWTGSFASQEAAGISATKVAVNISNSFAVQPEATALYAFLASPPAMLSTTDPVQIAGVDQFLSQVYENLFNRAADAIGEAYWQRAILSGVVSVGSAVYAIANGAQNTSSYSDQTVLAAKIQAASYFTTQTFAANLGMTVPLAATFMTAARASVAPVTDAATESASQTATDTYASGVTPSQTYTLTSTAPSVIDGTTGTTLLTFLLSLNQPAAAPVTVNYQTLLTGTNASTAVAGTDFVPAAGTVTFAAGQTAASVSIVVNGNTTLISGATVGVAFSGADLAAAVVATGTITTSYVAPPVNPVQTFTLTTAADHITAATAHDTVIGLVDPAAASTDSTLTAADTINGVQGGSDTLIVTTLGGAGDATNGALIDNIAIVDIRNTNAGTTTILNASMITGLTAANSYLGTGNVLVDNLANGAAVGIIGNATVINGDLYYDYVTPTAAQTISLAGGTNAGDIVAITNSKGNGAAPTSVTINSSGSVANTVGLIEVTTGGTGTVTALSVNASANLTATLTESDFAAACALTVSGAAANVDLGSTVTDFKTIDASGLKAGGLTIATGALLTSLTGGAGNNTVTLASLPTAPGATIDFSKSSGSNALLAGAGIAASLSTSTVVNGGNGFDAMSASLVNVSSGGNIKNFDALDVTGFNAALDVSLLTSSTISTLSFSGVFPAGSPLPTGDTSIVQNLANAGSVNVTGVIDQAFIQANNLGNATLTQGGSAPTLVVNFNAKPVSADPTAGNNYYASLGTLTFTGETRLTVASGGNNFVFGNGVNFIQNTNNTLTNITITGATAFTLGGVVTDVSGTPGLTSSSSLTTIDGSATTGSLTITAGADSAAIPDPASGAPIGDGSTITYAGLTIQCGSGTDTISISAKNGVVVGGSGTDTFIVSSPNPGAVTPVSNDVVTIHAGTGVDTLTSNLTYNVAAGQAADTNYSSQAGNFVFFDHAITGDSIAFAVTAANPDGTLGAITSVAGAATFDQAVFNAESASPYTATWFQFAGNTYIEESGASGGGLGGTTIDSTIIKFTGLIDLSHASLSSGAISLA